jgi:hypothetical protein
MRRPVSTWRIATVCVLLATGCVPTQPFYLHEDGDLSHYLGKATEVEHPDLHTELLADVTQSQRPMSVSHPDFKDFWDLSLEECVSIAMANSKIIRGGSAVRLQNGQIRLAHSRRWPATRVAACSPRPTTPRLWNRTPVKRSAA